MTWEVSHTVVPPNQPYFGKDESVQKTRDYDKWFREDETTKGIQPARA